MTKNRGTFGFGELRSVFLRTAFSSALYTALWIPVFITRCILVKFVKKFKPSYGKIFTYTDAPLEEDYWNKHPKTPLVFTLVLEAPIELRELRQLFTRNVLEAKIYDKKTGQDELRYPEFTQFMTDYAGYKFWKRDDYFNIANHITEQPFGKHSQSLSQIHTEMTNKKFQKKKSPWEITLIRNYGNKPQKTLLVYRCHHTFGDTISNLKVLVEGLGQKELKMPNVQYSNKSILDTILYYVWLPFFFVYVQVLGHFTSLKADKCPWKWKKEEEPLLNVAFTENISINDVKVIAKKNNVTASAVIMAAVAGGIAKSDKKLTENPIPIQWVLPKPDHPAKLANHNYSAVMDLPTDISVAGDRLQKCNKIFLKLKSSKLHIYDKAVLFQQGTWFSPLREKFMANTVFPLIVTNIASDTEGFQIGSSPCSELNMTPGTLSGACGVIICAFSYKDVIKVSATTKDGLLNEKETQHLVDMIAKEFQVMRKISK